MQEIMFPTRCLGCKSLLLGVVQGVAYYDCDTYLCVDPKTHRVTVKKSEGCDRLQARGISCS